MAFRSQRGGYANKGRGGNRGGSFNRGGRGGNNARRGGGGNNGGGNYLRSSTFVKNIIDEDSKQREPVEMEFGITEEIAFTLTAAKVQDLKDMIEDAENDPEGDGGIRVTMYCSRKENEDTGEEFDGANLLIVGKFPPREGGKGKSRRGGSFAKGRNNRRRYEEEEGDEGNDQETASEDTEQSGRQSRGNRTQGSQKGGRTRGAAKNASHSEDSGEESNSAKDDGGSYSEEPGW